MGSAGHRIFETPHDGLLQRLYEISKRLTRFDSVDATASAVVAMIAEALGLRSVVMLFDRDRVHHMLRWQAAGHDDDAMAAAEARARAGFEYFTHLRAADLDDSETRRLPATAAQDRGAPSQFITLPLMVDRNPVFGVLQLEGARRLDEVDLTFANAAANQVGIALERHFATEARHVNDDTRRRRAEDAEQKQRILASVSAAVSSSLDHKAVLAAVALATVPAFADVCFIDLVCDDGTVERTHVRFADPAAQRSHAEAVTHFAPQPGWPTPQRHVLDAGVPFFAAGLPDLDDISHDPEHTALLRAIGVTSLIVVPLKVRKEVVGALSFVMTSRRGAYGAGDVAVAEEIASRTAIAVDNARLFLAAQRATRARDDLLAVVSHDLRTPLNTIIMSVDLMRTLHGRPTPSSRIDSLERAALQMQRLIGDLLDSASIDSGTLSIVPDAVNVRTLIEDALEVHERAATSRSLVLNARIPDGLPALWVDGARIQQVVSNLVGNAIKFTPPGGSILVEAWLDAPCVTIAVIDDGPGISPEHLPHLFDRFWQAQSTAQLGTGLGLFIVKGIVDAHRGKLAVESAPGHGSKFLVTLPISA